MSKCVSRTECADPHQASSDDTCPPTEVGEEPVGHYQGMTAAGPPEGEPLGNNSFDFFFLFSLDVNWLNVT